MVLLVLFIRLFLKDARVLHIRSALKIAGHFLHFDMRQIADRPPLRHWRPSHARLSLST